MDKLNSYNDYVVTTKQYLKNYRQFECFIENTIEDINVKKEFLEKVMNAPTGVAKYGGAMPGGTPELNNIESAADERIMIEMELEEKQNSLGGVRLLLSKLRRALGGLDEESRKIVLSYYADKRSWSQISIATNFSERRCRKKAAEAIQFIAFALFGDKAVPKRTKMLFW